jgi:hypothetical protein
MLCNNIRTKIRMMANYRSNVVHGITNGTFFLHNGVRSIVVANFSIGANVGNNFVPVGINNVLARYKTDQ